MKTRLALAGLISVLATACNAQDSSIQSSESEVIEPEIGVLLASHCDIDDPDTELESYVKSAFLKNDGIPLPNWIRPPLSDLAYQLSYDNVRGQYDEIGPTKYRANAMLQVNAATKALRARGLNAKAYLGCDFTNPSIPAALDQMKKDGVRTIVMFNKGAQYSLATGGEHMQDAVEYLKHHPEWKPEFLMVKEFSSDERFRKLLGDVLERDVKAAFPGAPKKDVCILVASHGLPVRMVEEGDPATHQMQEVVTVLKQRFADYDLRHGYLNDDFFPGAKWTTPKAVDVAWELRKESCPNVYMDSRLSFTTHHRATLYDLNVEAREVLEEPDLQPNGELHPLYQAPRIVFGENFDAEPSLAELYTDLTVEALRGELGNNAVEVTASAPIPIN
ncbi:MAG: ferrochelatase [Deltaproteobacteria bacterium]|nr:ferrochelatase [Deltaproteobacteria bacterium]